MGTLIIDHSAAVDRRGDPFGLASQEPLLYFSSSLNPSPRTGRTTRPSRSFVITKAPSPPPLSSIDLGFSLSSPVIAFHVPSFCSRSIYRWERSRNRREDTISPLSPPFYARLFNLPSRIPPQFLFPRTSREMNATRATRPSLFFHPSPFHSFHRAIASQTGTNPIIAIRLFQRSSIKRNNFQIGRSFRHREQRKINSLPFDSLSKGYHTTRDWYSHKKKFTFLFAEISELANVVDARD